MKEKILKKLQEKRETNSQISDRTLNDLANSLSLLITTDEQLEAYDVSIVLSTIQGNIAATASEQVKLHQKQLQEAEEKKKQDEQKKKDLEEKTKKAAGNNTEIPEYVTEIMKQNQLIMESLKASNEQIASLKAEKVSTSRAEKLNSVLTNVPEWYANTVKLGFNPDSFKDDDSFNNYIEGVKKNSETVMQTVKEQGLNVIVPSGQTKKIVDDGQTPEFADALKIVTEYKQKTEKENATN